jgi:uncharacterized PurR-regulated membrane protein YhhQ (DUF165 family)
LITVALFLALIAAANIITGSVGPSAAPYVAFGAVGPALSLRDSLHERWSGRNLALRMLGLVVLGGLISFIAAPPVAMIAVASVVAFAASLLTDTVVYGLLRNTALHTRVNVSNASSALVDSFVFLNIAFGGAPLALVFIQFVAKVAGGALWLALTRPKAAAEAAA